MKATSAFFVVVMLLLAACDLVGGPERQLNRADAFLREGDYGAAAVTLRTLVEKDPDDSRALLLLARVQRLQGDTNAASSTLDSAARSGADAAQVASLRAEISLDQGKAQELITALAAGSPLAVPEQQRFRARALLAQRQPIEALIIVDELLSKEPQAPELLVLAAQCHALLGRAVMANRYVDQALKADPRSPHAWLMRSALQQDEDPDASSRSLQSALAFAPARLGTAEQVALLVRMATMALNGADVPAARSAHAALLKLAPQSPLAVLLGAQVQLLEGRPGEAVSMLQRLIQQAPEMAPARAALVGALMANGSYELALHDLSAGLGSEVEPQRIDALRAQVREAANAEPGSEEQALKSAATATILEQPVAATYILAQARKARPDSVPLSLAAIQLQLRSGQVKQALLQSRALADRHAAEPAVLEALAQAQSANGDHASAAATYEVAWRKHRSGTLAVALSQARSRSGDADPFAPLTQWLADHPQDLNVRLALAETARQLGQTARAASEYERVATQQPRNAVVLNNLAGLYQKLNDSRAIATASRAYELSDKLPPMADTYGWILAESGDAQAAVPILRQAVAATPDPDMRYHLGAALVKAGGPGNRREARILLADLLRDERPFAWRPDAEILLASLTGRPD